MAKAKQNVADLIADRPDLATGALEALDVLEAQAVEQAEQVRALEGEIAEHGGAISSDQVLRRYEELHALVEGELRHAKDTTALNTALRSLLSDATVDWIEGLGVEVFFTLAGDGPGLLAFAVGGRPDRIRREDHYSLSERSGIFAEKPERTPSSTGDSAHPCRSRRLRSLSKFDRQGAQEGQQTRRVNKQVRGAALGH